jgi:methylated-DNA-[protein]-cysteine S-methyltransferase
MGTMKNIERALRGTGVTDRAAAEAAKRFAARAVAEGLVDVAYTFTDSPFGRFLLASTPRGLVKLEFRPEPVEEILEELSRRVSPRVLEAPSGFDDVRRELDEYFAGRRRSFDVPLDWRLTRGFSERVLRATARIPYGGVSTYRDVAARAGNPRAMRAAGNALGSNPLPIVVPCHRVVRTGGDVGNYGGGPEMKRALLELEGALEPE